jgi:serine/threonine-protein kinase HipA
MKKGKVIIQNKTIAGHVWQDEEGYWFEYTDDYYNKPIYGPVSQTLPLGTKRYHDKKSMIAFFDGLIPEGWLLDIALDNWKINPKDRMELLLTVCKDCIGEISIERE